MAKGKKKKKHIASVKKQAVTVKTTQKTGKIRFLPWLIAAVAFLLYANTLGHQYALDDASVITDNFVVKKGVAGYGDIFTKNYRYGYWNSAGTLYRPISLAVFATIWQISPDNPFLFHLVNVLCFVLTGLALFKLLCRLWPVDTDRGLYLLAIICLLFIAHPVHCEVVANIKSLDEILSLLFSLLALYLLLGFLKNNNASNLWLAVSVYLLAMFSKENAVTFLAVFPLVVFYYCKKDWSQKMLVSAAFLIPVGLYLVMRFAVLEKATLASVSPLDNLLTATDGTMEWMATAFLLMGKYLWTLMLPLELSSDYGYNQILATGWGNLWSVLSLLAYLGLFAYAILHLKNRGKAAFGILFFLITFSIYSNLFVTIGSSYGERFLYMPSVGFCIALVFGLSKLTHPLVTNDSTEKIPVLENKIFLGIVSILFLLYAFQTVVRNPAWYDSYRLYRTDIQTAPNSAKLNYHLGLEEIQQSLQSKNKTEVQQYRQSAMTHFQKAIDLYPPYGDAYGQLGLAHYRQKNNAEALEYYQKALEFKPNDAKVYSNMGVIYFEVGDLQKSEEVYTKAVQLDPRFLDARRNLGSVYAQTKRFDQAIQQFKEGLKYDPNNATLHLFLGYVYRDKGDPTTAKTYFDQAYRLDPTLKQ